VHVFISWIVFFPSDEGDDDEVSDPHAPFGALNQNYRSTDLHCHADFIVIEKFDIHAVKMEPVVKEVCCIQGYDGHQGDSCARIHTLCLQAEKSFFFSSMPLKLKVTVPNGGVAFSGTSFASMKSNV
jgi:hypothetical protein